MRCSQFSLSSHHTLQPPCFSTLLTTSTHAYTHTRIHTHAYTHAQEAFMDRVTFSVGQLQEPQTNDSLNPFLSLFFFFWPSSVKKGVPVEATWRCPDTACHHPSPAFTFPKSILLSHKLQRNLQCPIILKCENE